MKQTKKSLKGKKETKTLYYMTAKVTTVGKSYEQGDRIHAEVTYVNEDTLHIVQRTKQSHVRHPELHWRDLVGSLHGKVRTNANGVLLMMYIRHGEYKNGMNLSDIFASEVEMMGESLSEMNMAEEVARCN